MLPLFAAAVLLAAAPSSTVAFRWQDPRISESSGLATASEGDLVYTHNDSGDEARVFAVGPDGVTRTTYVLPGLAPRDWEDMARGPDEQGRSSLWLGDIGDNRAARDNGLLVHRVLEPAPTDAEEVTTPAPTSFRLRYPDRPGDAETLLVHPRTGRLYVVTKPLSGAARVYAAPTPLAADRPNVLELVADVSTRTTGTPGGPGIGGLANRLVTAGDIAPDGRRVALRTYTDLYEWTVSGDDVAAAFDGEPTVTPLPSTQQGEGLAYAPDGASVLVSTEGAGSEVHRIVLERAPEPSQEPTAGPPESRDEPADEPADDPAVDVTATTAAGAAAAAVGLLALAAWQRRRARRRTAARARPPAHRREDPRGRARG